MDEIELVLRPALPAHLELLLQAQQVSVLATDTFPKMSDRKTRSGSSFAG